MQGFMTSFRSRGRLEGRKAMSVLALIALGGIAGSLGGCGAMVADLPLVGLPSDAPPRKARGAYLPVNDLPGQRDSAKLETAEQARLRAELAAERDRQTAAGAAAAK